ncbi:transcriptional regulator, LysR family [Tistlia consotensis]|uniref:Transcriptional regulator, LysR family n=1 Tax=Tistlia consotensis USBA 355 TaxID=560819 RepID=A0A1Y6BEJ9_9PROT|nr:LysR family transcriptional regulator [Tistlia consotensis]SMF07329.1 transcriptional regulator, LysR family [Tistlia consotensis USBA 355]SNR35943.1 transcriptional regulator, LysR family [Tistlia consotensis]
MTLDWSDLRLVLAVARAGSYAAAARRLGLDQSTVYRRVTTLERSLATPLFERSADGRAPTATGAAVVQAAEAMEREVEGLDARLAGERQRLEGSLRVTAPDDLGARLLLPLLARFRQREPGIRLELVLDNRAVSLTRREADVALRATSNPPESTVGRCIGPIGWAGYAIPALAGRDPAALDWIAWEEGAGSPLVARRLAGLASRERIVLRSNSLLNQLLAAEAGIGAALLPCVLGESSPALQRILPRGPAESGQLWLLTHSDLRRNPRVRALLDFLYEALRAKAADLAGPED